MVYVVLTKDVPFPINEEQLKKIFKNYDANGDGLLSRPELKEAFKYLGSIVPGFRAGRGLSHADANGDGYIGEEEMNELVKYALKLGYTIKQN